MGPFILKAGTAMWRLSCEFNSLFNVRHARRTLLILTHNRSNTLNDCCIKSAIDH